MTETLMNPRCAFEEDLQEDLANMLTALIEKEVAQSMPRIMARLHPTFAGVLSDKQEAEELFLEKHTAREIEVDFVDFSAKAGCVEDLFKEAAFIQGFLMGQETKNNTRGLLFRGLIHELFIDNRSKEVA